MKKAIAVLLTALLFSLSACNIKIVIEKDSTEAGTEQTESSKAAGTTEKETTKAEKETGKAEKKSAESTVKSTETKAPETSATEAQEPHDDAAPVESLHLLKYGETFTAARSTESGIETICRTTWAGYGLTEDEVSEYSDLARVLDGVRDRKKSECKSAFYQICNEPYTDMFDNRMSSVVRSDSRAVSILCEHSYWHGGDWHLERNGLNLDPLTGEDIALTDVVRDLGALCKKLEAKLTDKYGGEFTGNNFLKDGDYFSHVSGSVAFAIGYEGLTVYFNEGQQASDWLDATLYYDEAPELFNAYYTKTVENYAVPFDEAEFVEVDVDGDGKREVVTINGSVNGDYVDWTVRVNGNPIEIKEYSCGAELYLVRHSGKYYAYLFQRMEGDYCCLAAVDLAALSFAFDSNRCFTPTELYDRYDSDFGENGSHYETLAYALTDPDEMMLETSAELLGNNKRTGTYAAGNAGYPVLAKNDYGTTGCAVVEAKKELKCDIVNEQGKIIGVAIIEKGELLYLARSDYETYADVQKAANYPFTVIDTGYNGVILRTMQGNPGLDPDETIYRLEIKKADWSFTIGGEPETEVFNGILYAG